MLLTLAQKCTRTIVLVVALATLATGLVASTAWAEPPRGRAGTHPDTPPSRSDTPPPGGTPNSGQEAPLSRRVSPSGGMGHDVSHPQCGVPLPSDDGNFGIVGINEGRPFTTNPCLSTQYQWASGTPYGAGVYLNTSSPIPDKSAYMPRSGTQDPAL